MNNLGYDHQKMETFIKLYNNFEKILKYNEINIFTETLKLQQKITKLNELKALIRKTT